MAIFQHGVNNIAIGVGAGGDLKSGRDNILIGNGFPVSTSNDLRAESHTMRLGQSQPVPEPEFPVPYITRTFIAGISGVTTGVDDATMVVIDSEGQLGTISSSRRYKQDIHDLGDASEALLALRPVSFRYAEPHSDGEQPLQYGLIAEEVAAVMPGLVVFNKQGQPETVKYHLLSTLLLSELQKVVAENRRQQVMLNELQARQDGELRALRAEFDAFRAQSATAQGRYTSTDVK